jgi:hypothetical protein
MQQLGRLQLVLGYWPEARYLIEQQGGSLDDYRFYPISGGPLPVPACGLLGHTARARSHRPHRPVAAALRRDTLPALYARWLDPNCARTTCNRRVTSSNSNDTQRAALKQKKPRPLGKTTGVKRKPMRARDSLTLPEPSTVKLALMNLMWLSGKGSLAGR